MQPRTTGRTTARTTARLPAKPKPKNWPVLVGIGLTGVLSGVLIAGQGTSLGTVSAAPGGDSAAPPSTTLPPTEGAVTTVGTTIAGSTTTVPAGSTTTVIVDNQSALPSVETTLPPEQPVDVTLDAPIIPPAAPEDTSDIPVLETLVPTTLPADAPPDEGPPEEEPGPGGTDRATLRLVIANADARPDLEQLAAQRLIAKGYGSVTVANDTTPPAQFTTVYYRPGFNRAAVTVTLDLEAENVSLEPMPTDLTTPLTSADGQGDVIVMLGPDIPNE